MSIRLQNDWTQRCNTAGSSPQFWGIVNFGKQTESMSALAASVRGRSDILWTAGEHGCLVCEKGDGNNVSLASCSDGGAYVAVAGEVWPVNGDDKRDAQLVADLYQSHADGLINHADGQFATAVVDERNRRLVLSVNWPGGFHRIYYCTDGSSVGFATRLDLLIHRCGWPACVNGQAVVDLLRFGGLVADASLLEGVHRVVPGFAAVLEHGQISQRPVFEYPVHEVSDPSDTADIIRLHREAIQRRVGGRKDFGLFLSGGLDSGMNVATAAELSVDPVKTFNVAFDGNDFDESPYARLIAAKYNTEHVELRLDTAGCLERLPEMVWAMQEPISDYSYIPTFHVAEAIKKHVAVAIGGDGPDHLLGRSYAHAAWYDLLRRIPFGLSAAAWSVQVSERQRPLRHAFWQHVRKQRFGRQMWQSLACMTKPCGSGLLNSFCTVLWGDRSPSDLSHLLSPDLLSRTHVLANHHDWAARWENYQAFSTQYKCVLADASLSGLCGVFAKVGGMCSAHNLMIHEPYLASPVIRYICGLKNTWKVGGRPLERLRRAVPTWQTKRILREAAAGYLPDEIIMQKQKHGFEFPLVQCWQQATSGVSGRQVFGALVEHTDWFVPDYLDTLVREQASGERNHRYMLLLLAALDQWVRIFIQGAAERPTWHWSDCLGK